MKKIVCLLTAAVLIIGLCTSCSKEYEYIPKEAVSDDIDFDTGFSSHSESGYVLIDENESLVLKADLSNGEIVVQDKKSGKDWYSNPVDKEEDVLASGFNRVALYSQVLVSYSTSASVVMNVGSYNGCVTKGGLESKIEQEEVIFKYTFEKEGLVVPVRYSLDGGTFVAEILTAGVEEVLDNTINTIELLPFFGATGIEEDGYFMVPDGSGALIHHNNGKTTADTFVLQELFGFDNGVNDKMLDAAQATSVIPPIKENAYLPIYGNKSGDDGFLAVLSQGAGRASINARVSGKYTSYNTIWSSYRYRSVGTVRLMQKEMVSQTTSIAEKNPEIDMNYEIRFMFLEHGHADYSNMADMYRNYLIETEGMEIKTQTGDIPFYLNLSGYIVKKKSTFGIPKDTKIVMTAISDAESIVNALNDADIHNVMLKYNHWMKDGYYGKIQTHAKTDSIIGSQKEMLALQDKLEAQGGKLYLTTELMNVYKTGNGVSRYRNVLNSVANTPQMQYEFALDALVADSRYTPWYLVKIMDLPKYMNEFLNNFTKKGFHYAAIDSIGTMAYSDLSKNGISRSKVPNVLSDVVDQVMDELDDVMVNGANSFIASKATHILNTPTRSSNYDIVDVDIPFYQMVFHGYSYYSVGATNLSSNPDELALMCLEYGASPMFSFVGQNSDELVGSRSNYLFSSDYERWITYAIDQYHEVNEVLRDTVNLPITKHEYIAENVAATTYGNETTIYVNYNNVDVPYDGHKIPARGYLVVR